MRRAIRRLTPVHPREAATDVVVGLWLFGAVFALLHLPGF